MTMSFLFLYACKFRLAFIKTEHNMTHFTTDNTYPCNLHMDCLQLQAVLQKCNFFPIYQNLYITMKYLGRIFIRNVDSNMHENAPI